MRRRASANDPAILAREYATSERLERRRQNLTGWLRGEEAWDEALAAVAEARPHRVLDARARRRMPDSRLRLEALAQPEFVISVAE